MSGLFENVVYSISRPINLKSGESASVEIARLEVFGKRVLVYDKKENEVNAIRSIHLVNNTDMVFAPGVITVVDNSRFVGQSLFTPMLPHDDSLIPYGEDSSVMIRKTTKDDCGIVSISPNLNSGKLMGVGIRYRKSKLTTYYLKNSSNTRSVDTFYIDHHACVDMGGYVITTTNNRIKSVTGFSRYELTLSPNEEIEFPIEEEVYYTDIHNTTSEIESKLANRTISTLITPELRNDLEKLILKSKFISSLRQAQSSGNINEEGLLFIQSRFLELDLEDEASINSVRSMLDDIDNRKKLLIEQTETQRQLQLHNKNIKSIEVNQSRLRENLDKLKGHENSSLVKRYLDDMNRDEDLILSTRKVVLDLEEKKERCDELIRDLESRIKGVGTNLVNFFLGVTSSLLISNSSAPIPASSSVGGPSHKRIDKEYLAISTSPMEGFTVEMDPFDRTIWTATMFNLPYPYSGGRWKISIKIPPDYPFRPPTVRFLTPIYHCNFSSDADIRLDILTDQWNPGLTISKVLDAIRMIVTQCDAQYAKNTPKGKLYLSNQTKYEIEAQEHTRLNASE